MHSIKLAQQANITPLAKVLSASFTEADPEKPWDEAHALAYLAYWFKKQPDMFFVAFDDDRHIGAMVTNIKPWRTGIRCTDAVLFVDSAYQKQGIGKELIKKVLSEAMQKYNATSFEAITFAAKQFPLTWYERIGITPDEHAVLIKGDCQDILNKLS